MIFVYKTMNIINGKYYIGVHEGKDTDAYLGSGVKLKKAIKKYGLDNFKREIIQYCDTRDDAYLLEKMIVTPELISSGLVYNLNAGGHGGWHHAIKIGNQNVAKRPEVKKKISDTLKANMTDGERAKRSERMSRLRSNGTIVKPMGWTHSQETRDKISERTRGRKSWNKGLKLPLESADIRRRKSAAAKLRASQQDMGALTRGKKYNMHEKTCPYCGIVGKGGNMTRYHFENCKSKE